MPYDTAKMLDLSNLRFPDREMLRDLQGNVLKGHGREHTLHLFFAVRPGAADAARAFLAAFPVTDAMTQLDEVARFKATGGREPGGVFRAAFLTAEGYRALGVPEDALPGEADGAFRSGMRARHAELCDPVAGDLETGYRGEIHGMLLVAYHDEAGLAAAGRDTMAAMAPGLDVVALEQGRAYKNRNGDGVEHFGYVDGRSQPLMIVQDLEKEAFVLDGITRYDPRADLDLVLVRDPAGAAETSFGSFFVFRKLEQNVDAFKKAEKALGATLRLLGEDEERAGAMVVGRFEDGTPLIQHDEAGHHSPVSNNFDYEGDPQGLRCPLQAHIRKTNPRTATTPDAPRTVKDERKRHMARRGITYGVRETDAHGEFADQPKGDVGLLFMAYQASLEGQFEVIQRHWANAEGFIQDKVGLDPVIGQFAGAPNGVLPQTWRPHYGAALPEQPIPFHGHVRLKGGEYFFAPSLSGLKGLGGANPATPPDPTPGRNDPTSGGNDPTSGGNDPTPGGSDPEFGERYVDSDV